MQCRACFALKYDHTKCEGGGRRGEGKREEGGLRREEGEQYGYDN